MLVLFALVVSSHALRCVGPNGAEVDWYMMLKVATQSSSSNPFIKNGTAYTYIDSKVSSVTFASADITTTSSPLGRTLAPIYSKNPDLVFMYNDDTPDGKTGSSYGHTKGVMAANGTGGFWLIHSVPSFPPEPQKGYSYISKGLVYGQSFLCLSLDKANLNKVGKHHQHNHPQIYVNKISAALANAVPDLAAAMNGTSVQRVPATHMADLNTVGGTAFRGYSKNAPWGQDLAPHLIIPDIKADMVWETWMRPYEPPFCPARPAKQCYSAATLSAKMQDGSTYNWKETEDHSKWGISTEASVPITCIGDVNRMASQRKRGGGAVCMRNSTIHSMFSKLILTRDNCNSADSEFASLDPM